MRLLLLEDDVKNASFIIKGMKEAGFRIDHATDGETGLAIALSGDFDGAIVDLMLPKLDGLSIIETLRERRIALPVTILSARRSIDDRVKGL